MRSSRQQFNLIADESLHCFDCSLNGEAYITGNERLTADAPTTLYINHAHRGFNLRPKKVTFGSSLPRVIFIANRDIHLGETLWWNYGETDPAVIRQNPWLRSSVGKLPTFETRQMQIIQTHDPGVEVLSNEDDTLLELATIVLIRQHPKGKKRWFVVPETKGNRFTKSYCTPKDAAKAHLDALGGRITASMKEKARSDPPWFVNDPILWPSRP